MTCYSKKNKKYVVEYYEKNIRKIGDRYEVKKRLYSNYFFLCIPAKFCVNLELESDQSVSKKIIKSKNIHFAEVPEETPVSS